MLQTTQQDCGYDYSSSYSMFKYSVRSELTRKYYERRLKRFFDFISFMVDSNIESRCNSFSELAKNEPNLAINQIISFLQFQKGRTERAEIAAATLKNFVKTLKLFCEISDVSVPWKKITRGLPRAKQAANDRAPTVDEIRKLLDYPDRRIKPIVYAMISSGIRIGAWDYMSWSDITPIGGSWFPKILQD